MTCRECKGGDGIKSLRRSTVLEVHTHLSKYITCWSDESETCLEEYEKHPSQENADRMLNTLTNQRRKRWVETVENLDFKHSSQEAWTLLNEGKYPRTWKLAKVIAIQQPGKPVNDPASYRTISLLCCTFKLFEQI